ncbi:MAG: protein kinase [Pirellulales bacterium]|nr:protein kinase [Pirellulales bacterium]
MELSDLPASELARIDSICLDFEAKLRSGDEPSIDELIEAKGGRYGALLRRELLAIRDELSQRTLAEETFAARNADTVSWNAVSMPAPGTMMGPYRIGEMIGRGGMGVVFKATDQRLERQVAIKVLAVDVVQKRDLSNRFDREAKAVAALSHPNIVELFDVGVADGLAYAVMEFLDGELLEQRLLKGALEPDETRRLGAQVADALAAAHAGGVIHRDLKPHNIMLVQRTGGDSSPKIGQADDLDDMIHRSTSSYGSTVVKLFDFGLSRVPAGEFAVSETGEGIILGTPGYMSPEQVRGEKVSEAADIFSLGCVLYEAFYGTQAFQGDSSAARFKATIEQTPPADPISKRKDPALADLIDQCLQKDPNNRPESAASIAAELRRREPDELAGGGEAHSGVMTRRVILGAIGGAAAMGAAALIFSANRKQTDLTDLKSIAVLSFTDRSNPPVGQAPPNAQPIGDREVDPGEELAGLLVHELSRLSEFSVPRFRPMRAETPQEFRQLGTRLEVDALLTGSMETITQNNREILAIDLQLVSASTGNQLWGKRFHTTAAENLVERSMLAKEIASVIGRGLVTTAEQERRPNNAAFRCLVDGEMRSDPESVAGLEKALMCFEHAHKMDGRFADSLAGIALTSLTLAAQSPPDRSLELIGRARKAVDEALKLDPTFVDARLASAMLDWQTTNRYAQARRNLNELAMVAPNNWLVLHQYGLLKLATGEFSEALRLLREAAQLNPWSVLAKVDRARAVWFSGNTQRAIQEGQRIRDQYGNNLLARGLLVDIFEQQQRFEDAAAQHDQFDWQGATNASNYQKERRVHLLRLPYGPFGSMLNQAIWQTRTPEGLGDLQLNNIADQTPPMLPLLLAVHPSFAAARSFDRAIEILPASIR